MTIFYENQELLFADDVNSLENWFHEGVGELKKISGGGLNLHCFGSFMGDKGCMAFFRKNLPDQVSIEYEITVKSHGGMVLNYIAIRGLKGEDLIEDKTLEPRTGIMRNYFGLKWGLQSYHISFSRFGDDGVHTQSSNWRRNPGMILAGHGNDPVMELNRKFHIRITKDLGHLQFFVDGVLGHAMIDRDSSEYPIPDHGKFGFRLIGTDVQAEIRNFKVYKIAHDPTVFLSKKNKV